MEGREDRPGRQTGRTDREDGWPDKPFRRRGVRNNQPERSRGYPGAIPGLSRNLDGTPDPGVGLPLPEKRQVVAEVSPNHVRKTLQ